MGVRLPGSIGRTESDVPKWGIYATEWGLRLTLAGEEAEITGLASKSQRPTAEVSDAVTRPYDIVVLGATGFTGRLIVEHLDALLAGASGAEVMSVKSWAVAGRSADRLRNATARCRTAPGILEASTPREIDMVASQCRVLIAAAGPFADCGEAAIKACIAAGTHYVDVSGETPWMHDMVKRYHEDAKKKGVMVVHAVGQVCAIDEMSCYLLAKKLGPLKEFREYFFNYGGTTGGTFATSMKFLQDLSDERFQVYSDPFNLGGRRACGQQAEDPDIAEAVQDKIYPTVWLQPAYNGHTGARIIRRSCQLFEECPGDAGSGLMQYGSSISVVIRDCALNKRSAAQAVMMNGPVQSAEAARSAARQMKEQVVQHSMPRPGEGPPPETRAHYFSEVFAVAQAEDGRWAHVHYKGPEAYEVTAMAAVTGAVVLLDEAEIVKASRRGGVVTPAFAFHDTSYVQRLEAVAFANSSGQRMTFRLNEGIPTEATIKDALMRKSRSAAESQAQIMSGKMQAFALPA